MAAGEDGTTNHADAAATFASWISKASFSDLAEPDLEATRKIVLDTLATLLAGSSEPPFEKLAGYYRAEGGRSESSILVHGGRVPVRHATIMNSAMARALDFDDAHEAAIVHTGAPIVPAALAVAERIGGVSGRDRKALALRCGAHARFARQRILARSGYDARLRGRCTRATRAAGIVGGRRRSVRATRRARSRRSARCPRGSGWVLPDLRSRSLSAR